MPDVLPLSGLIPLLVLLTPLSPAPAGAAAGPAGAPVAVRAAAGPGAVGPGAVTVRYEVPVPRRVDPSGRRTGDAAPLPQDWLPGDKVQHFWISYGVTAFAFAGLVSVGAESDDALRFAVPVGALAGVGKEVHDRRRGGPFSFGDLVADALGVASAWFLLREVR